MSSSSSVKRLANFDRMSTAAFPLTQLIGNAENGIYQAKPARVFSFDDIVEAHRVMESGQVGGKMTVSVS